MNRGGVVIRLTPGQVELDARDAQAHFDRARANGWTEVGFDPGGDVRRRHTMRAYMAETAVAVALNLPEWRRDPNGFGKADVGGYSVRYGSLPHYGLVTHDRDHGHPYILVVDEAALEMRLVGWLPFDVAVALRGREGHALPGTTAPWVIPQRFLWLLRLDAFNALAFEQGVPIGSAGQ